MWAILSSALWSFVSWVFRKLIIKFVLYTGLLLFVSEAISYLGEKIPVLKSGDGGLSSALSSIPAGVWYFLNVCQFSVGLPMILAAFVTRFCIKRLPIIG